MSKETGKGVAAPEKTEALEKQETPLLAPDDPQDAGKLALSLSAETLDAMTKELREALHQIANGFGELTAPGTIFSMDQSFHVIDGFTIPDYVDQTTGEEKAKHIFRLEFDGGVVRNVMQSDARPRRVLARAFTLAANLGGRLRMGPYKFEKKPIPRQIQPAYILVPQPGFKQEAFR